jgi:hypothetical protein
MTVKVSFFPVGNGHMTLIGLESGRTLLIDINIRQAADKPEDETPDVAKELRQRLKRDSKERLYVDAFLLSHPDKDHCAGLCNHFHLGPPDEFNHEEDKIFIREIWSSPMVFRRASKNLTLCEDAEAFNREARRRVQCFREQGSSVGEGDRILILSEDEDGKTDDLEEILIRVDEEFSQINGLRDQSFKALLLGPLPKFADEDEEEVLAKNRSSTILQIAIATNGVPNACLFLTGGDAEVAVWERFWDKHSKSPERLAYDLLQTPHHCSWHSLSYDSWSELREKAKVSPTARNALCQARSGAFIVASSNPIHDDDNDPPCIRAKQEYEAIAREVKGKFLCVGEHPSKDKPGVLEFEITDFGPRKKSATISTGRIMGAGLVGRQPLSHG